MDSKKVLIGGFTSEIIESLKSETGYFFYVITKDDTELVVSEILRKDISKGDALDIKFVLLNGLTKEEIFGFIEKYKKLGLPKALFAMVTPHSINWKLKDLIYHLIEEEREMRRS
jgi:hypothetical protein